MNSQDLTHFDRQHLWHPYTIPGDSHIAEVVGAQGIYLHLSDGTKLIDATSSWWCVAYGHQHPHIVEAIQRQATKFTHVMFGSFTHAPAVHLAEKLLHLVPAELTRVFFADSGSVSVECALKLAIQYQYSIGRPEKNRFITIRGGYHGDTTGAMAVCDPEDGMHHIFSPLLRSHFFAPRPTCVFDQAWTEDQIEPMRQLIETHHQEIAGCILEPIFQGAGGMYFYSPKYLSALRALCEKYDILLVFDEIATGFGRTGKPFAQAYAEVVPDIMCVGKALTGGAISLAAMLCNERVATAIRDRAPGAFMHGPTFMANPLACAAGCAALDLFDEYGTEENLRRINRGLTDGLSSAKNLPSVQNVRTLGAIGVIEMCSTVNRVAVSEIAKRHGVHLRPFGRYIYTMPPLVTNDAALEQITHAMCEAATCEIFSEQITDTIC